MPAFDTLLWAAFLVLLALFVLAVVVRFIARLRGRPRGGPHRRPPG